MFLKGNSEKLGRLKKELEKAREAIACANNLEQFDRAKQQVEYYKDLIQRIEHKGSK
jgi:hypothetical protein